MSNTKNQWERLAELIEEEHIADFFVNMVLYIAMRLKNIPEENRLDINFSDKEMKLVDELWEMDFISKKSPAYYYRLMNAFVESIYSYSPKILGVVFDTVYYLPNERSRMKSFLILTMGFVYIEKGDLSTAKELLENFPEYSIKNWLVGVNILKLRLINKNEIKEEPFELYDWTLEFYDARKDEFEAFGIEKSTIALNRSQIELEMGFPKKSFVTLKKMISFSSNKDYEKIYDKTINIADFFLKEDDVDEAENIFEWLASQNFTKEVREKAIYETGRFYRSLASKTENGKAQEHIEKAESYFKLLEDEFPESELIKKIGNRLLRKKNAEDFQTKSELKELLWIFFMTSWLVLLSSFIIKFSFIYLIIYFVVLYMMIYFSYNLYIKEWFFGEED